MRFRRALDRGNVTEALSAASELQFVALAEALELTLLLADKEPEKYDRAADRWHVRFVQEVPNMTCVRTRLCSPFWRRFLRTGSPVRHSPSSSAAGDRASGSPRRLSAGRGRLSARASDLTRGSAPGGTSPCPFHATPPRKPPPPQTPAPFALLPARLRSRDALWRPLTDAWRRSRR